MASGKFVSYLRVSTARQGRSGLGLDAQRSAVTNFLNGGRWQLVKEFVEVESGKRDDRTQLMAAMTLCRAHGATLVIAKLDRLSRDAAFLLTLQKGAVKFVATDMPDATELTVGILAVIAEGEGKAISARTKAALAEAKAHGTKLGGFRGKLPTPADREAATAALRAAARARGADLAPIVAEIRSEGVTSANGIAKGLTARGVPTARGATTWSAVQVQRLLANIKT